MKPLQKKHHALVKQISTFEANARIEVRKFAMMNDLSIKEVINKLGSTHLLYISETGQCTIMPKNIQDTLRQSR
ncbi:MAG: hypothetical protein QXU32_03015 [Nitrososphaerales archaeon]